MSKYVRVNYLALMLCATLLGAGKAQALNFAGYGWSWGSLDGTAEIAGISVNSNGVYLVSAHIFEATVDFICDNPKDKKTYRAASAIQSYTLFDDIYPSDIDGNGKATASFYLDFDNPDQVVLDCHQNRFNYVEGSAIVSDFYVLMSAKKCKDSECTEFVGSTDEVQAYCKFPLDISMIRDPSTGVLDTTYQGTEYQCTDIYLPK